MAEPDHQDRADVDREEIEARARRQPDGTVEGPGGAIDRQRQGVDRRARTPLQDALARYVAPVGDCEQQAEIDQSRKDDRPGGDHAGFPCETRVIANPTGSGTRTPSRAGAVSRRRPVPAKKRQNGPLSWAKAFAKRGPAPARAGSPRRPLAESGRPRLRRQSWRQTMNAPVPAPSVPALRPEAALAPTSGIVDVVNYGRTRPGLIPLWVGEGDRPTPGFIGEAAARSLAAGETFYTYQRGIPELREALARYHERVYGGAADPERFFVTSGGMHAVQIAVRLVAGSGDEVLVPTPAWPNFVGAITVAGARPVSVPLRADDA